MVVTRGSKNSLFFVFDSLSNLDCDQWYKFWIYQSHPMSASATQSVDSRAIASFSKGHFCVHSFFCWMVGHFLLRIATTLGVLQLTLHKILYSFPVVLLWNTCACCNWRQHLQRLSPHGLQSPTVDEGLDTTVLTSVFLMLLGRRNVTTGGRGNNLASLSLFS